MYSYIKKLKRAPLILVLPEINLGGGGTKTLISYIQEKKFRGEDVVYIILNQRFSYFKLLLASIWGRNIIINSLFSCSGAFVKTIIRFNRTIKVYTHESAYYFEQLLKSSKGNSAFLKNILARRHILYSSEWQYRNTRKYLDPAKKTILYECLSINGEAWKFIKAANASVTIGMAGYLQERKGIKKFEEIAARSHNLLQDWQFVWIGGKASDSKIPNSANVQYLGNVDGTLYFLNRIDLLLFTSLEDPLPLVILETILLKKKMLCYKENGFYDLLQGIKGIAFFDDRDSIDAIIEKANDLLSVSIDEPAYDRVIDTLCSVSGFIQRIEQIND